MSDGPSYIVHQPDGTTFGPADVSMLREWVAAGIVTRTTALSLQGDDGKVPAAVVPGLFEPEQQGQATAQPAEPMYQAHLPSGTTDALTIADLGRLVEAGDVVSTTPISLVGGSKKVPAAVVPGLEDAFRNRKDAERLEGQPVQEQAVEHRVEPEVGVPQQQNELTSDSESGDVSDDSQPATEGSSPAGTSAVGILRFLLYSVIFGVGSLVVCLAVIGFLTKIEFPVFGDRGWRSDATKEGLEQGVGHGWRGALWSLVVALVILVAVLVQRWGANFWSCFLLPVLWLGISTVLMWGKDSHDREACLWGGVTAGIPLGYWFAAILSAIWFGPHPLAR